MANVKLKNASGTEVTYNGVTSVTLPTAEGGTATFGTPSLQSKTATPTSSAVNVTPDSGYDGLSQVAVEAVVASNLVAGNIKKDVVVKVGTATDDDSVMTVTGTYEGGGGGIDPSDATATANDILYPKTAYIADGSKATGTIQTKTSTDLTASGDTVNVPAGYYAVNASKSVTSGTEGTPTATKGAVSNHSVTVTPSVTNQAGYIAGGTHTGTAVTVSASELASGTKSIVANGTGIDVVGFETVDVAVPSGGDVDIETLNVNANGTYNAPSGKAYGVVVVDVPQYDWKGGTRLWNYAMYPVLTKSWEA